MISEEIKALYELTEDVLLSWLDNVPTDKRELKALELLADAGQCLHSACVNLGIGSED
ncbi:MAG: hypothetical protein PHE96_02020 [Methylococcales bacterium]|nr:hypothetical protein [Methylococcales bacterium]